MVTSPDRNSLQLRRLGFSNRSGLAALVNASSVTRLGKWEPYGALCPPSCSNPVHLPVLAKNMSTGSYTAFDREWTVISFPAFCVGALIPYCLLPPPSPVIGSGTNPATLLSLLGGRLQFDVRQNFVNRQNWTASHLQEPRGSSWPATWARLPLLPNSTFKYLRLMPCQFFLFPWKKNYQALHLNSHSMVNERKLGFLESDRPVLESQLNLHLYDCGI